MAAFSKQYCELHDMGFDGDFDIMEEYYLLSQGYSVNVMCEGFGFLAIARGYNDEVLVAIPNEDHSFDWIEYKELIK